MFHIAATTSVMLGPATGVAAAMELALPEVDVEFPGIPIEFKTFFPEPTNPRYRGIFKGVEKPSTPPAPPPAASSTDASDEAALTLKLQLLAKPKTGQAKPAAADPAKLKEKAVAEEAKPAPKAPESKEEVKDEVKEVVAPPAKKEVLATSRFSCTPVTPRERLYVYDLQGFHHRITTSSQDAQTLFDQGMMLAFTFNQPEALRSFQAGLELDPQAPMLHWGVAYALGPYLNKVADVPATNPMLYPTFSPEEQARGLKELQTAKKLIEGKLSAGGLSEAAEQLLKREKQYVEGLLQPFSSGATYGPAWRSAQQDYADALLALHDQYPEDKDALVLAAEALINLQPWKMYDEAHKPQGRAEEIVGLLQSALVDRPDHPLAQHLLVHAVEQSKPGRGPGSAGRAEAAADHLAAFNPSFGHLTHMASHTYNRVGRWHDSVVANARALEIDQRDAHRCLEPYMPVHNSAMLLYAAGQGGELGAARDYAKLAAEFPERFGPTYMSDGRERTLLPLVLARFGEWDAVLSITPQDMDYSKDGAMRPEGAQQHAKAVYHYTRALALGSKAASGPRDEEGKVQAAALDKVAAEVAALQEVVEGLPEDPKTLPGSGIGIWSPGYQVTGRHHLLVAQAQLAALRGDVEGAVQKLNKAIAVEKEEGYTEPPRVYVPARQYLGQLLLNQGKNVQAAAVFIEDLKEYPENVWSLSGLSAALKDLGDEEVLPAGQEAGEVRPTVARELRSALLHADVKPSSAAPAFKGV